MKHITEYLQPIAERLSHIDRYNAAERHIKAGDFDAALKLYDDPAALASERRVIKRHIEKAKAIRQRVNTEEKLT